MSNGGWRPECKHGVLGGTFSLLHAGHRHLLRYAWSLSGRLTVGVTTDEFAAMLGKSHPVEPYEVRALEVLLFLLSLGNKPVHVVPLNDPYGPAVDEKEIDCIFVSEETFKGAYDINLLRRVRGYSPLRIYAVEMKNIGSKKISSTLLWARLRGARRYSGRDHA